MTYTCVYKLFEMTFTCQFARLQTFLVYVFVSFCTSTNLSTLHIRVILRVYKLCDITTHINFLHRWYRLRFSNDASLDFPPKRRSIRSSFSWTPPSLWWFRIVPGLLTTFPLFLCPFSYNEWNTSCWLDNLRTWISPTSFDLSSQARVEPETRTPSLVSTWDTSRMTPSTEASLETVSVSPAQRIWSHPQSFGRVARSRTPTCRVFVYVCICVYIHK